MSSIDKLSIQGIRSFSPESKQEIQFGTPLTLIVGSNGCGKTTIIECLKYSTTGDMPPNSKGGAFVFDPKIKGSREVSAQVRLNIRATDQKKYSITRNLQTTIKGKTQTFKTLESDIGRLEDNGTVTTMSSRAQGLDEKVPKFLGVSKSILEYVIFTHQEDSLWPLSEPSVLKKRFDEIFQVFKFSKSVDILKNFKKESIAECKTLQETVNYLKTDKNRSESTKFKINSLQSKIDSYESLVSNLKIELQDIINQQNTLFQSNKEYEQILSKLDILQNKESLIKSQLETLKQNLSFIDNKSIDDLKNELNYFEENLLSKNEDIELYKSENLTPILNLMKIKNQEYNKLISERGEYKQMFKMYETNKEQLNKLVDILKSKYQLDSNIQSIDEYNKSLTNNYEILKRENMEKLQSLQINKNDLITKSKIDLENLNFINNDIFKSTNLLKVLEKDLNKLLKSPLLNENHQLEVEQSIEEYKQKILEFDQKDILKNINKEIEIKKQDISHLENDLEKIQDKIIKSKKQSDIMVNYNMVKKNVNEHQVKLKENYQNLIIQNQQYDNVFSDVKIDTEDSNVLIQYKELVSNFENQLDDFEILNSSYRKKYENLVYTQRESQNLLESKNKTIQSTKLQLFELEKSITRVISLDDIDSYFDQVTGLEETEKELLEGIKAREVFGQFFQKSRDIAEESKCCFLCERTFKNDEEGFKNFINRLDSKLLVDVSEFIKEKEEIKQKLFDLKQISSLIQTYKDKLPTLKNMEKEWQVLQLKDDENKLSVEKSKTDYDNSVSTFNSFKKLKTFVATIDKSIIDIETETVKLEKLTREIQLTEDNLDLYESLDELDTKQISLNKSLKALRKEVDDLQVVKENQAKTYNKLQRFVSEQSNTLLEIENINAKKSKLEQELQLQEENLKTFQANKIDKERIVTELKEQIGTLTQQIDGFQLKFQSEEQHLAKNIEEFSIIHQDYKRLYESVISFEEVQHSTGLDIDQRIGELENKINDLNQEIDKANTYIDLEFKKLNDSTTTKNNIRFNIEYLKLTNTLHEINTEITNLDFQSAQVKRDQYESDANRLKNMYEQVSSENASKVGEIKQLRNQISEMTHLLNTEYKGIDRKYMESLALLQSKTLKNADLEEYSKIVEMSIIKYHASKMKEINRVLDELWRSTYVGSDITTIEIKTEQVTNARGRSYNYKVVMFKDGYELDMRGRCSAGQKVLASILIRLALSESFGSDCGVIALDEPTTNLDEDNIASLAQGLHNIIQARQHQRNFQIIIITHDEKFLRYMKASDFADGYFKVDRDSLSTSTISWVDIKNIYN